MAPDLGLTVATNDPTATLVAPPRRREWSPTEPDSIDALQVIYKVAERCNIDCTYCYYFNMGDETPFDRPALTSRDVTRSLAEWIAAGCRELRIPRAKVCFHGGEPLLLGRRRFDDACRTIRQVVEPVAEVTLAIQTNGLLIDDAWVDLFDAHTVAVGVSIDGPAAANDRFRLDRHGRSTFAATEAAIVRLVAARPRTGTLPSTISVLHHGDRGDRLYRYLRDLGVTQMNFLLPDRNADDRQFIASGLAGEYGRLMGEILVAWLEEDDPDVRVKFIDEVLAHFRAGGGAGRPYMRQRKSNQVVIARSDGTVAIDDTYIPALSWYATTPVRSTAHSSLREFLDDPVFRQIEATGRALPTACGPCRWREACRGGDIENRFSTETAFDNPSVYCDAYIVLYETVCEALIRNGYPAAMVAERFGP